MGPRPARPAVTDHWTLDRLDQWRVAAAEVEYRNRKLLECYLVPVEGSQSVMD